MDAVKEDMEVFGVRAEGADVGMRWRMKTVVTPEKETAISRS